MRLCLCVYERSVVYLAAEITGGVDTVGKTVATSQLLYLRGMIDDKHEQQAVLLLFCTTLGAFSSPPCRGESHVLVFLVVPYFFHINFRSPFSFSNNFFFVLPWVAGHGYAVCTGHMPCALKTFKKLFALAIDNSPVYLRRRDKTFTNQPLSVP
uniref:Uncharacterized protein TCIL3000_11_16050 n=1 Tax=Trypanosoma congolense (strain IL3000) TaxID=1068625 RepID=G0V372_TRYCI|nr:unnamed protein product [Trypanosoma congolense IL3000]